MLRHLRVVLFFVVHLVWTTVRAATLHVGPMQPYADPRAACKWASPGDTVLMHPAEYRGTYFLENIIFPSFLTAQGLPPKQAYSPTARHIPALECLVTVCPLPVCCHHVHRQSRFQQWRNGS
ncbi:MAG: hypothetical protein ACKOBV_07150 [Candidatus Kapaibacterium sp.]